jgi:gamma-resorcylate decarboxylase
LYYDDPRFDPFWERVEALGAPIYLHPRNPLPANQGIYEGYPELLGASWAFTVETSTHMLRLMVSGLFDRFPTWPSLSAISYEKPLTHYLRANLYVTTSGFFRTQALYATISEIGCANSAKLWRIGPHV